MKKIFVSIILLTTLLLAFTGCSKKESHLKEITLEEFKEKIANKESFPLFVGNDGCSHCVSYKPVLESVLDEYDITVYHIDNSALTEDEYKEFRTYLNISGTPTLAFIVDGEEETTLNRITGEATRTTTVQKFKNNGYIK